MSLSAEDRAWIRDLMRSEIAASEERTYRRIKDGALSELRADFSTMNGEIVTMKGEITTINEKLDSMGEDLGKVMERVEEIPLLRQDFDDFRQRMDP